MKFNVIFDKYVKGFCQHNCFCLLYSHGENHASFRVFVHNKSVFICPHLGGYSIIFSRIFMVNVYDKVYKSFTLPF